jgi:hypothetical protein
MWRIAIILCFFGATSGIAIGSDNSDPVEINRIKRIEGAFSKLRDIILEKNNNSRLDVFPPVCDVVKSFKESKDLEMFLHCLIALNSYDSSTPGNCVLEAAIDLGLAELSNRIDDDAISALTIIKFRWADGGLGLILNSAIEQQKKNITQKALKVLLPP